MHRTAIALTVMMVISGFLLVAQAPPTTAPEVHADMNQLMRGVLYPAANVVFVSQSDDPDALQKAGRGDPAMSPDPFTAAFGGWLAVENAALTLAESANLLALPGRLCSTGVPAPDKDPGWIAFVQQLREGSMQAYRAAQTKSQEQMIEASNAVNASCEGCHRRWRSLRAPANRCK